MTFVIPAICIFLGKQIVFPKFLLLLYKLSFKFVINSDIQLYVRNIFFKSVCC